MKSLDPRKWPLDVMCVGLVVFICVGVLAAVLLAAVMNRICLVTRTLNPFSREMLIQ